jgi:tetratricopeptide (TPR) repeat protein
MVYLGMNYQENPHEYSQGMALCTQGSAYFRKLEDKPGMAYTFNTLGELARLQGDYEAARHYYEESLSVVRETGERQREAMLYNNLCFVAYHQQDYLLAMHLAQRSMIVARELKSEFRQACFLATLAGPMAVLGQPERAARLLGASHARFEALGTRHQPADQPELDLFEATARNQLGDEAFQDAWQAGQAMTLQEAVSLALKELDLGE